jgi:hypothetical protein
MRKKEELSKVLKSDSNIPRGRNLYLIQKENKFPLSSNLFNNSNDSIINNSNNDIIINNENDDDFDDIDEENIFEKSIGDQVLLTPINETHRLFSSKNRFGKGFPNSISIKKNIAHNSKSPDSKSQKDLRNRNAFKNAFDNLAKSVKKTNEKNEVNEIFSSNYDFLHCRNCMLIVALNRYGKYYFNK